MVAKLDEYNEKMMQRIALTSAEEKLYAHVDAANLKEKINWLSKAMKLHVEKGEISKQELDELKKHVTDKLEQIRCSGRNPYSSVNHDAHTHTTQVCVEKSNIVFIPSRS